MEIVCKNCDQHFEGHYCNNCGQSASVKRINVFNVGSIFLHGFFHIDKGFFYTIKELSIHPGKMLREYVAGKRITQINHFYLSKNEIFV